ncbi:hypothetical protein HYW75_00215 [Candidatus Pacearchaeota archaeon]|nr:hypothetical protein [Candidatus Pacearchaeota archaeon]
MNGRKGKEFSDVTSYNSCNLSNYVVGYEWIKNNVPKDAVIFTWWEEAHTIRAFAQREVVLFTPSEEYAQIYTLNNYSLKTGEEYVSDGNIKELALAFSTHLPQETKQIMKKKNSGYIFLSDSAYKYGWAVLKEGGVSFKEPALNYFRCSSKIGEEDCTWSNKSCFIKQEGSCGLDHESFMYHLLKLHEIEGFEKIYSDPYSVVYKIIE